ncbi:unnamed protein product [Polarella glacialis]|uniref:Protein kinase domain-containing protein n=1 Tax=Polarella glacialis TaxID=89957 RepID=A0A813JDZ3_POLGL|nr:unnamed protein product [Polarella glacialis]
MGVVGCSREVADCACTALHLARPCGRPLDTPCDGFLGEKEKEKSRLSRGVNDELVAWAKTSRSAKSGAADQKATRQLEKPLIPIGGLVPQHGGLSGGSTGSSCDPLDVFELKVRPLGFGAQGEVLLATHRQSGALRACKQVSKALVVVVIVVARRRPTEEAPYATFPLNSSRRSREVEAMLRLDHPNVARLFEVFEDEANVYLIMELLSGGSVLDRLMPKSGLHPEAPASPSGKTEASPPRSLEEREAAVLFRQMLSAVLHLHGHGVVHRDLKLDHFLFAGQPQQQQPTTKKNNNNNHNHQETTSVKLVDFGMAKVWQVDEPLTPRVGTRQYMAPEADAGGSLCSATADRAELSLGSAVIRRV